MPRIWPSILFMRCSAALLTPCGPRAGRPASVVVLAVASVGPVPTVSIASAMTLFYGISRLTTTPHPRGVTRRSVGGRCAGRRGYRLPAEPYLEYIEPQ